MSPRTALILLVLGSAAASARSSSNSVSMVRSLLKNNLDRALALSKLPPGAMSMIGRFGRLVGRYQSRARSNALVIEEEENVWNAMKLFKVCAKCPPPMRFFEKEQDKEAPKLFSSRTAILKQAVLEALKESLTQPINQGAQKTSGNTVNSRIRLL